MRELPSLIYNLPEFSVRFEATESQHSEWRVELCSVLLFPRVFHRPWKHLCHSHFVFSPCLSIPHIVTSSTIFSFLSVSLFSLWHDVSLLLFPRHHPLSLSWIVWQPLLSVLQSVRFVFIRLVVATGGGGVGYVEGWLVYPGDAPKHNTHLDKLSLNEPSGVCA